MPSFGFPPQKVYIKLLHAWSICREILIYLTVVKLIHGKLPGKEMLHKYDLVREYEELTMAVRTGNLGLFDHALMQNQTFYMKKELFLLIQLQLKNQILRNFIKRVYLQLYLAVHSQD